MLKAIAWFIILGIILLICKIIKFIFKKASKSLDL